MEPKHAAYIDALRGYAILMVIAVHTSQYFDNLSYGVVTLANQGARGVQLFFIASALTLCMSWKARHDGALPFYVRRFFRIAPMFYLAILFFVFYARGFGPSIYAPDGIGLRHILMTATFTHGLTPDTITSVVPGGWSVADEMMFYALFPLLVAGLGRVRFPTALIIAVVITFACCVVQNFFAVQISTMPDAAWRSVWSVFNGLSFVSQFPCFLFGMLVFKWFDEGYPAIWPRAVVLLSIAAMVFLAFKPHVLPIIGRLPGPLQYGMAFALFAAGLSRWQPLALVNPVIGWIGKISFSGYLIHLALISTLPIHPANYAESFGIIAAATLALSSVTYFVIEKPFNRLGRRLARRIAERRDPEAVPAAA
jgi:peptidoglycan/LPS O-acetylase OafA/YrhL